MISEFFEVKNMHKSFGPTIALKDVSLSLKRGEIRGLVGENGSGKSTVMSIVAGMQPANSGEMYYNGTPWSPHNMVEAQKAGISMILQEANTIPGVSVAQNIFAGREDDFSVCGIIRMKKMYRAADEILTRFGIKHIHARDMIDRYSFEDRKLIELARCVSEGTEILIIDETSTALSHEGRAVLYRLMHEMADKGKCVVFISHDIDEILEQCTVVTVLRDGEISGELSSDQLRSREATQQIRYMMVGREIGDKYYREDYEAGGYGELALELNNISFGPIKHFSLKLHKGQIIGFGGLSGCGMHEIGRAAFGLIKLSEGSVLCDGIEITSPLQAINIGIGYISKDRDRDALILDGSIGENIVLPSLPRMSRFSFINPAEERAVYEREIETYRIKCYSGSQPVNTLSGGNKQKVSFAKWTAKDSKVLIMDCPTRGVDVGVKQSMYSIIEHMKSEGKAIIMISEELTELIGMVDRLIIMKDFAVTGEFARSRELCEANIINYMV